MALHKYSIHTPIATFVSDLSTYIYVFFPFPVNSNCVDKIRMFIITNFPKIAMKIDSVIHFFCLRCNVNTCVLKKGKILIAFAVKYDYKSFMSSIGNVYVVHFVTMLFENYYSLWSATAIRPKPNKVPCWKLYVILTICSKGCILILSSKNIENKLYVYLNDICFYLPINFVIRCFENGFFPIFIPAHTTNQFPLKVIRKFDN